MLPSLHLNEGESAPLVLSGWDNSRTTEEALSSSHPECEGPPLTTLGLPSDSPRASLLGGAEIALSKGAALAVGVLRREGVRGGWGRGRGMAMCGGGWGARYGHAAPATARPPRRCPSPLLRRQSAWLGLGLGLCRARARARARARVRGRARVRLGLGLGFWVGLGLGPVSAPRP